MHVAIERGHRVRVLGVGKATREELVEEGAQRVDVGGGAERAAERLLGCHVGGSAEHVARPGGDRG